MPTIYMYKPNPARYSRMVKSLLLWCYLKVVLRKELFSTPNTFNTQENCVTTVHKLKLPSLHVYTLN